MPTSHPPNTGTLAARPRVLFVDRFALPLAVGEAVRPRLVKMRITAANDPVAQDHDDAVAAGNAIKHFDMNGVEAVLHQLVQSCGRKRHPMASIVHGKTNNRTE